ncbi:MAG: hypothetical protein WCI73_11055 [Phycisphaerae bacterium]
MWRRWIIRCLFILPLLLCVVGWVLSGWYDLGAGYGCYRKHAVGCVLEPGCVGMGWWRGSSQEGWFCNVGTHNPSFWLPEYLRSHSFLGFVVYHYEVISFTSGFKFYSVYVPFWFLILLSAAVLFIVWRKTRPKNQQLRAFPLEVKASGQT